METKILVDYIQDVKFDNLDVHTINIAKMCIQDLLGVSIAGSKKREAQIWKKYFSNKANLKQASIYEEGFSKISYTQAAALNAVYGHVMDMDDVHNASITHMGVITIPTAIALGQYLNKTGKEVIESIIAGYEVGSRIGEAINPSSYKYWHTTGVVGAFSSGAVAGKLLGLTNEEMLNCFGSAGTQAAGLWQFLESGTMSKTLHTANANICGIRSAELAKLGFTGAPTILEGERGFIKAMAPEYDLDALTKEYDMGYRITTNSFKPYACCRHTHSANYSIERILSSHELEDEDILEIIDDTYSTAVQTTNNPYPENPYAAKFSLQFCIAAAIIFKDLSDKIFTFENITNPRIKTLMSKIRININDKLDAEFKSDPNQWSHRITIKKNNGEKIIDQVDYPIGDFNNPFDWEMADRKFLMVTDGIIHSKKATELINKIKDFDKLTDINELFL